MWWDGRTPGAWTDEVDGCDAVINLAGRSVSCRYTETNLREMMDSRVESARAVGAAIEQAARPPAIWLQMSTATIYAHRFDAPNDEVTGLIGGDEKDTPGYWSFSVDIAKAWEATQAQATTPRTRKVALRTAIVMSPDRGGAFDVLLRMARLGLGGPVAGGAQYVSWIHDTDFVRGRSTSFSTATTSPGRSTSRRPIRCRTGSSCGRCGRRGVSRSASRRRGGWPSSARSSSVRTPSSC